MFILAFLTSRILNNIYVYIDIIINNVVYLPLNLLRTCAIVTIYYGPSRAPDRRQQLWKTKKNALDNIVHIWMAEEIAVVVVLQYIHWPFDWLLWGQRWNDNILCVECVVFENNTYARILNLLGIGLTQEEGGNQGTCLGPWNLKETRLFLVSYWKVVIVIFKYIILRL